MSSRNLRLDEDARATAPVIGRVLDRAAASMSAGEPAEETLVRAREDLAKAGMGEVDYLELRGDPDLKLMTRADRPARLFLAAWLDGVRLIDNVAVAPYVSQ
jgi:pantoate--beta-alanine ligase